VVMEQHLQLKVVEAAVVLALLVQMHQVITAVVEVMVFK